MKASRVNTLPPPTTSTTINFKLVFPDERFRKIQHNLRINIQSNQVQSMSDEMGTKKSIEQELLLIYCPV